MIHCTRFRTMWNVTPSEGVTISSATLTEPDQICLTVREILTRFGALPTEREIFSGQYESENDALAASAFDVLSKEEALERSAELAEQFEQARSSVAKHGAAAEESPIPSSPQAAGEKAAGLASTGSAGRESDKES